MTICDEKIETIIHTHTHTHGGTVTTLLMSSYRITYENLNIDYLIVHFFMEKEQFTYF